MITITLAPCVGVDKPFAAVTKEIVVFAGADVPDGLQVALFDGFGTCLAVADIKDAQATLDLDTQEAVDATAPVGPGEAVTAWLVVGDKNTHIATIPCNLIRNLIDDGAVHPSVPAERYPTVDELAKWLEAAGEVREGVCTCAKAAASSAEAAGQSATTAEKAAVNAQHYASDAANASTSAAKSYENAEASRKAAESAAQVAREARENAQLQQQKATAAAGNANGYRQQAQNAQRLAERAQEAAEEAQQAAETARDQASQSAQEAGAKADEANQAAAGAGSASSAAQSAKAAAEQAKQDAVQARDSAQTAKQAAEAAKAGAESAKAAAEAAKTQAATSASGAAQSATAAAASAEDAQEAAQGLQEGLATLNTLDGRVTFLETGEGVYKNPNTGKVTTFTPLPGSDGTLKVIKELPNFYKVTPMEEDISNANTVVTSDGRWFVIGVVDHLYFYDSSLNRLGKWHSSYCRMAWEHVSTGSGRYALWEHTDGHLRCMTQDNGTPGKIYLYDVTAGAVLKAVTKPIEANYYTNESIYNLASGHILTRHNTQMQEDGTPDFFWLLWDADLNPIVDEATGAQKRIDANAVFDKDGVSTPGKLFELTPVRVMQMASEGKTLITSTRYFDWGERGNNVGLWTFGADDLPIQIMEHAPVEDPERPGHCQCEKNEDGTIKREWDDDRNCYFPRLVTQELGPALFKRAYPAEYGLSAGGNGNGISGLPYVAGVSNYFVLGYQSCLADNRFMYLLTHDNKLINTVFFNNEFLAETRAPRFTYQFPIPNASTYGKFKFSSQSYMTIPLLDGYGTRGAVLYPIASTDANFNLAVLGSGKSDNGNPFAALNNQKSWLSPLSVNNRGQFAAAGKHTFFSVPTWYTNFEKAFNGVL